MSSTRATDVGPQTTACTTIHAKVTLSREATLATHSRNNYLCAQIRRT